MLREKNWERVEEIARQLSACIGPEKTNNQKAKKDFYDGTTRYYSFPLQVEAVRRGYLRVVPTSLNGNPVFVVDHVRVGNQDNIHNEDYFEALNYFSCRMSRIVDVVIPEPLLIDELKTKIPAMSTMKFDGRLPEYKTNITLNNKMALKNKVK